MNSGRLEALEIQPVGSSGSLSWLIVLLACVGGVLCGHSASAQESASAQGSAKSLIESLTVPQRTDGQRTLVIDEDLLADGVGYYLLSGEDTQLAVTLSSRFVHLVATTSRAVGVFVGPLDPDDVSAGKSPLFGGSVRVPAASLHTNTYWDEELQSERMLDTAHHTDIGFVLTSSRIRSRTTGGVADSVAFALDLEGSLQFKGASIPLKTEAELTFYLTSNETLSRGIGDLARLESRFEIPLEALLPELAARNTGMFGETVSIELFLVFSTVDPERPLIAPSTPETFALENHYVTALRDRGQPAEAYDVGERLITAAWNDADALQQFALSATYEAGSERRFLGQARRALDRAQRLRVASGDDLDAFGFEALATIEAETGAVENAIALQRRALAALEAGGSAMLRSKPAFEADLALYEAMAASIAAGQRARSGG